MRHEETRRTAQLKPSFREWRDTEIMMPLSSLGRNLVSKTALDQVSLSVQLKDTNRASNFSTFLKQTKLMPPKPQALYSRVRDNSSCLEMLMKEDENPMLALEETFARVKDQF